MNIHAHNLRCQVSYRLNTGHAVIENLACLFAFMLLATYCLWRNLRAIQATWAEALLSPKGTKLRRGARGSPGSVRFERPGPKAPGY